MERITVSLVDTNDNLLGYCHKQNAHEKPLLHRAFSIFLVDGNKMLLHRRALVKYHCGGLWTNACCSHPVGDTLKSAKERLQEELGITCEIKEVFKFVYYAEFKNGLYEYELDHTFIGQYSSEKQIPFDKNEIEELLWISFDELKKLLYTNPQMFTPWFLHACPRVLEICENNLDLQ